MKKSGRYLVALVIFLGQHYQIREGAPTVARKAEFARNSSSFTPDMGGHTQGPISEPNDSTNPNGDDNDKTNPDQPAPIPEPATMLLFGSGLIGLAGLARRKFKK